MALIHCIQPSLYESTTGPIQEKQGQYEANWANTSLSMRSRTFSERPKLSLQNFDQCYLFTNLLYKFNFDRNENFSMVQVRYEKVN